MFWAIAISNINSGTSTSPWPFFISELLAAFFGPVFLICAGVFGGVVLKFITKGRMDASRLIPAILPCVTLEHSETESFWVIAGTFYYKIDKPCLEPGSKHYKFSHAWDKSLATWCLTAIIATSVVIAVSYFANETMAEVKTVKSCGQLGHEVHEYSCFSRLQFEFINCSERNHEIDIHCFRFLHFVHTSDPIGSLVEAVVLYLVTVEIFDLVFKVVRILLRFKPSRNWGKAILVLGLLWLFVAATFLGFSHGFALHVELVRLLQLMLIGVAITFIGILLVKGKWWEKVPEGSEITELMSLKEMKQARLPCSDSRIMMHNGDYLRSPASQMNEDNDNQKDRVVVELQLEGKETEI